MKHKILLGFWMLMTPFFLVVAFVFGGTTNDIDTSHRQVTGAYEYRPGTAPVGTQPVVWLMFEEDLADGIAEDSSGNGFSARCSPGTSCPLFLPDGGYDGGGAYFFDGTKSYLDLGTSRFGIDQTSEFTLSLWVKPAGDMPSGYYKALLRKGNYVYPLGIDLDREGRIWSYVRTNTTYRRNANISLRPDTWYHVAVTFKKGTIVLYINGEEHFSDRVAGKLNWGYSSSILNTYLGKASGKGDYFRGSLDEVRIYKSALAAEEIYNVFSFRNLPGEQIELYHADFHGRLGQKIFVQVGESDPSSRLVATLKGDNGHSQVLYRKEGNLLQEEVFVLNQRLLKAGTYSLRVQLLSPQGRILKEGKEVFNKPYDGVPKVGIDENNALCVEGIPFFPVFSFLVNKSDLGSWIKNGYVNASRSTGYYRQYSIATWKDYLNSAASQGAWIIGPNRGEYWPHGVRKWQDETGKIHHDRQVDLEKLAEYVKQTKDHPALLMWDWQDEPDLGGNEEFITPQEVRKWTEKSHELDPQHPVMVNLVGYNFTHEDSAWHNNRAKGYFYLYNDRAPGNPGEKPWFSKKTLVADVYSMDYYPFEYATWKNWVGVEDMALAMDRMRQWNFDLVPIMACVETTDVAGDRDGNGIADGRNYPWTPAPTPEQVRMLAWANVVHGAKGINWFHYFEKTPAENFQEMARFTDQITRLTPVVLGPDYRGRIVDQELDGGRVDFMAKQYGNAIYLFAVNMKDKPERVRFFIEGADSANEVEVLDENRRLSLQKGELVDLFQPHQVHIYRIETR